MAKATALARARRVKQRPKPKPQSAQIGPDGPKHPDNRQLYNKRGCPDAGARLHADYPKPKVATFCAALWLTFTLPLTQKLSSRQGDVSNQVQPVMLVRSGRPEDRPPVCLVFALMRQNQVQNQTRNPRKTNPCKLEIIAKLKCEATDTNDKNGRYNHHIAWLA